MASLYSYTSPYTRTTFRETWNLHLWAVELDCDLENEAVTQGAGEDAAAPEEQAAAAAMKRSQTLPPEMLKSHPYSQPDSRNGAKWRKKGTKAYGKAALTATNLKNTHVREHLRNV